MNQEQITKQAKKILDNFSKELEKVKIKPKPSIKKLGGFRQEKPAPKTASKEFKKLLFNNAPEKHGDFLVSEKRKW